MTSSAQDFRFINTKTSFAFRPGVDRLVRHNADHPDFMPSRGVIHVMPNRAKVIVTAPTTTGRNRHWPESHNFNLYGYSGYDRCPDWLRTLLRQVGYGGLIE